MAGVDSVWGMNIILYKNIIKFSCDKPTKYFDTDQCFEDLEVQCFEDLEVQTVSRLYNYILIVFVKAKVGRLLHAWFVFVPMIKTKNRWQIWLLLCERNTQIYIYA